MRALSGVSDVPRHPPPRPAPSRPAPLSDAGIPWPRFQLGRAPPRSFASWSDPSFPHPTTILGTRRRGIPSARAGRRYFGALVRLAPGGGRVAGAGCSGARSGAVCRWPGPLVLKTPFCSHNPLRRTYRPAPPRHSLLKLISITMRPGSADSVGSLVLCVCVVLFKPNFRGKGYEWPLNILFWRNRLFGGGTPSRLN